MPHTDTKRFSMMAMTERVRLRKGGVLRVGAAGGHGMRGGWLGKGFKMRMKRE